MIDLNTAWGRQRSRPRDGRCRVWRHDRRDV